MERTRVAFSDPEHPDRSGALILGDDGRMSLVASPALAEALRSAATDPDADLAPLRFDDRGRGIALARALAKGVPAFLLECGSVAAECTDAASAGLASRNIRPSSPRTRAPERSGRSRSENATRVRSMGLGSREDGDAR